MLFESIKMSWENIISNKLRSILTMLGIVIGVASIIALITIVQGATNSINQQITDLGANKIMVSTMGTTIKQGLTDDEISQISELENISGLSPTISGSSAVVYKKDAMEDVSVQGKNEVYFNVDSSLLKSGRPINRLDIESKNQVAIIGNNIVKELFYGINPIGKELIVHGTTYKIIGTLTPSNEFGLESNNDTVIIRL